MLLSTMRPGGTGSMDLWLTSRTTRSAPWAVPTPIDELNTTTSDHSGSISPDGLVVYFSSTGGGGVGGADLLMARRPALDQPFAEAEFVTELNSSTLDTDPWPA